MLLLSELLGLCDDEIDKLTLLLSEADGDRDIDADLDELGL